MDNSVLMEVFQPLQNLPGMPWYSLIQEFEQINFFEKIKKIQLFNFSTSINPAFPGDCLGNKIILRLILVQ